MDRKLIVAGDPEYSVMVAMAEDTQFSNFRRVIVFRDRLWRVWRDEDGYRFYLVEEENKRFSQLSKFYNTDGL